MHAVTAENIFNVYSVLSQKRGVHNLQLGRICVTPEQILVLSDYTGALRQLQGPADPLHLRRLRSWAQGSSTRLVSLAELQQGHHPELVPEMKLPQPVEAPEPQQEQWFRLERPELQQPLLIQFLDGVAHMQGQPLSEAELESILEDTRSGRASIRYHRPQESLDKMEAGFIKLMKGEVKTALAAVEAAIKAGHLDPEVMQTLHREIFFDAMVPGVKNKKSFHDEIGEGRHRDGVYVMLDGNNFGAINKLHGHASGDSAIKAMGGAIRTAMDESVGAHHQDLWRFGGDEFAAWLPSHDHAAVFLRTLRQKLEAIPPIGGTHNLSMSAGIGATPAHADAAMTQAKRAKAEAQRPSGQAGMHVHSLIPGHEGDISVAETPVAPAPAAAAAPR